MNPTENELTELNAWIAEHVMGRRRCDITDPAAAMQLLEKCGNDTCVSIRQQFDGTWYVWSYGNDIEGGGNTLPLAIARFAKALYSK